MKKVLIAAFAGACVLSSIMATPARTGKISRLRVDQIINDSVPGKKTDTSSYPKRDTAAMPRLIELSGIVK